MLSKNVHLGAAMGILCGCIVLSGCTKTSAAGAGSDSLVIFLQGDAIDHWCHSYPQQMAAAAQAHSGDFKYEEKDSGGDAKKQIEQIKDAIAEKPKVLIINPASEAVLPQIAAAHNAGIYVILVDRQLKNSGADAYVGINEGGIAFALDSWGPENFGNKGQRGAVVLIPGTADEYVSQEMRSYLPKLANKMRNITFVMAPSCDFQRAKAKAYVEGYLKSGKPVNAIDAGNDQMALGALDAVSESKNSKVDLITTVGADNKELMNDVARTDLLNVLQLQPGGPTALDEAADYLKGTPPQKERTLFMNVVRSDNIKPFMQKNSSLLQ